MSILIENFVEIFFSLGLFINAMLFIPQGLRIYRQKNAKSVSLTMFLGFCLLQLFTIFHAILKHDTILLVGYILSFLSCGTVTFLIIKYR